MKNTLRWRCGEDLTHKKSMTLNMKYNDQVQFESLSTKINSLFTRLKLNLKHNDRVQFESVAPKLDSLFEKVLEERLQDLKKSCDQQVAKAAECQNEYWNENNALRDLLRKVLEVDPDAFPVDLANEITAALEPKTD